MMGKDGILGIILIMVLCCISLAGCGQEMTVETEQSLDELWEDEYLIDDTYIVVGFVQVGSESDWRIANTESFNSTFTEEKGYYFIFENGQQEQENQLKSMRSLILQQVDYIILDPIIETGWDAVLQEAKDAGIPVIIVDRMVEVENDDLYTCWIGSDFYEEGVKAGEWLAAYLEELEEESAAENLEDETVTGTVEDGAMDSSAGVGTAADGGEDSDDEMTDGEVADDTVNIVTLQGTIGSSAQIGRTEGFAAIASQMDNWNILEQQSGDFTQAKGKEVMEYFLRTYDDIDVVVSENDNMTFGAIEAIKEAGMTCGPDGDIIIISFDAVSAALQGIIDGNINVDFECNPMLGSLVEEAILALENRETVEKIQYVDEVYFDSSMDLESIFGERTY